MPQKISPRKEKLQLFLLYITLQDIYHDDVGLILSPDDEEEQFLADYAGYLAIKTARYSEARTRIPRLGNLHILWDYAKTPVHHHLFIKLVRVSPQTFLRILAEIEGNPVFQNDSNHPQAPVETQLAVALWRLGRFGNAASMDDCAFMSGIGHGTVADYTHRVITAVLDLHQQYVRLLTDEERARERQWVLQRVGCPEFAPGIYHYDGSNMGLWRKPGLNGDAYWGRHNCYELNVQVCYVVYAASDHLPYLPM
jgi:hypothetical protein